MNTFNENDHPRDKDGKFSNGDKYPKETRRFNELMGKVVKVDLSTDIQKQFDNANTHSERQHIAFNYIKDKLRGTYNAKDGREVLITKKTANKFTNNSTDIKLRVAPELGNLIEHSEFIKIVDADKGKDKFEKFAYYEVNFDVGNDSYVGLLNVGISNNNMSILYDLRPYSKTNSSKVYIDKYD